MLKGLSTEATPEQLEATGNAYVEYTLYAAEVIAARRKEPGDDLMSILVHAEVDGDRLSDDEILQEALLILIGGDETTRHVISGGVHQLLLHRDQWDRLGADPDARPAAVEEMLRWVTPIKNMVRTATRDVELGGKEIREGDELMLLYPSANRDETVFEDPFRFDSARTPNEHLAFGFGSHFCLGSSLARLEIAVMLDELVTRMPNLAIADPEAPVAMRPANFISGLEVLPVRF
jgi:cytochrome P450 family 142 subfamily A polypeptide 1